MNDPRRDSRPLPQSSAPRSDGNAVKYPVQVRATFVRLPRQPTPAT
jgi:hypothetical protein